MGSPAARAFANAVTFWAMVVIDPIYQNGELVGFAKITRDLTERRAAEEALQRILTEGGFAESGAFEAGGDPDGGCGLHQPG